MKKEGINELLKIFEQNQKKVDKKEKPKEKEEKDKLKQKEKEEKEKAKQKEKEEKEKEKEKKDNQKKEKVDKDNIGKEGREKSGSFSNKSDTKENLRERFKVNKSVYVNASNINKIKPINNDINNSKELESVKKANDDTKKDEKNIIKQKTGSILDKINKFSNKNVTTTNNIKEINIKTPEPNQQKNNSTTKDDSNNNQINTIKSETKNEKINNSNNEVQKDKEYKPGLKDKVLMFNSYAEKNKNQDNGTKDFYNRRKTYFIKGSFKKPDNFAKEEINSKEYKQSFDKLHNLQNLLKKESSLRELCKYINY